MILKNKTYFFLTKSVFEEASKNTHSPSFMFLQQSVLLKLFHRNKMNRHIVFYPLDGVEEIKTEFGDKFEALVQIGENMFCPEFNPKIKGNINTRILDYSTDMNGNLPDEDNVKIICANKMAVMTIGAEISMNKYPIEHIFIDDALKELGEIESEFKKGNSYFDGNTEETETEILEEEAEESTKTNMG